MTEMLNITKAAQLRGAGRGIDILTAQLPQTTARQTSPYRVWSAGRA